jgi:hypothetical protein
MRTTAQIISVCAIAVGVGLLVGGITINPDNVQDVGELAQALRRPSREFDNYRELSAVLKGIGAAFLALGTLGLVVPWANVLVYGRRTIDPPLPS